MSTRRTQEEFVRRAREVHGDKYDYSESVYVNHDTKILIRCNACGKVFPQSPASHLQGSGCPECGKHCVKNKLRRKSYKDGILDIDFSCSKDEITTRAYKIFNAMFRRCNSPVGEKHNPAYKECSVCDEWHYFSNFKKWFDDNYIEGYALDKDILVKGNKVYSPSTCCFVPIEINSLLTNRRNHRNGLIGTWKTKRGTFMAHCNEYGKIIHLGTFPTQEEAFNAYKQAKEAHIKDVATQYYNEGKITEKVYNALMNYKVEITD